MELTGALGRTCERSVVVGPSNVASSIGSGGVEVFSTPSMVALMETAARDAVEDLLPEGWSTVGTSLDIRHTAATPPGEAVTARAELVEVEGRRLRFRVSASDRWGTIGEGTHERFAVDLARFGMKVAERCGKHEERGVADV
ncbi:thioesterase family protein [Candidatus Fermentibacteria bacterium]|nr:thioesterase family protein [Candidatus Fermentibacteria bacterium]